MTCNVFGGTIKPYPINLLFVCGLPLTEKQSRFLSDLW